MKKLNMTIGKFQPFTKGHINMINEGEELCIVYRINTDDKLPDDVSKWKVQGRKVKKESIQNVIDYLTNGGQGKLTEQEKEIIKRPFTNALVDKELDIVEKHTKNIMEIVPVKTMYDALFKFNKFITDHADEYEPCYWMCGDDRQAEYDTAIEKYDEVPIELGSTEKIPNVLKGKLKTNIGKGRTEGVSGTAVRKSIITKDKAAFDKIMPPGVSAMFNDFTKAFDEFKDKLQNIIKEWKMISLKDYIYESVKNSSNKLVNDALDDALTRVHPRQRHQKWIEFCEENLNKVVNNLDSYVKKYNIKYDYFSVKEGAHEIFNELFGNYYEKDSHGYESKEAIFFDALCTMIGNYLNNKK